MKFSIASVLNNAATDHSKSGAPCVLQIVPSLDAGGAERATIDIARALKEAGWTALVASTGGRLESELAAAGGEMIRMDAASKNPRVLFANAALLTDIIRIRNISLIHARSRAPAWSALLAARRANIPFVTTFHGIYNAKGPLKRWYNGVMARGDAVIANSEWTAGHIRNTYPAAEKRLVTIPRGLDLAFFDPATVAPERVAQLRAQWGIRDGERIVLLPGRLARWKGQLVLLDALASMRQRFLVPQGMRAVIVGDAQARDSYRDEIRERIARHGLSDIVTLSDHLSDMPAAYLTAEIVVSASTDPEGFGRVAPEAAAMGRPVIATDHGGARETVLAGVSGLLTPPGDAAALAGALVDLFARTPERLAAMGAAGRAHVRERFTVARMCAETLAVYRNLIARR